MGNAGGFESHISGPQHQGGEAGTASLGHLPFEDVGRPGAVIMAVQGDASTGRHGDLAEAQLPARQGGEVLVEGLGAEPPDRQHTPGHAGGPGLVMAIGRQLFLSGYHPVRLGQAGDRQQGEGEAEAGGGSEHRIQGKRAQAR